MVYSCYNYIKAVKLSYKCSGGPLLRVIQFSALSNPNSKVNGETYVNNCDIREEKLDYTV